MLLITSLLAFSAFVCALAVTPLARDVFKRAGLVDHPNGSRKTHSNPIPRVGGVSIVLSIGFSIAVTAGIGLWGPFFYNPSVQLLIRALPAIGIVFLVGLVDDACALKPWQKLLGQLIGAILAYAIGLRVMVVAGVPADNWLSLPLTIGWLLLCTNAFNLIDGIDGLSAGAGLFATLTILLSGVLDKDSALVLVTVPLAGALLGFLPYNFNPASVFLGDSGSLLLGFLLGCFGIIWRTKTATFFGMASPLLAMFVPILDVTLSVARRLIRGQPIFTADRRHLHHRLLDRGLTPRAVVLLLYAACAIGAVLSLLETLQHNRYGGLVVLLFCAGTWVGVQNLRYAEFRVAGHMLFGGTIQRLVHAELQLREYEEALDDCGSFEEWWLRLCDQCRKLGFASVELNLGGQILEETFAPTPVNCWSVIIPMLDGASFHLAIPPDAADTPSVIMPFVDLISRKVPQRLTQDSEFSLPVRK